MTKYNWDIRKLIAKRCEFKDKLDAFGIIYKQEDLRDLYDKLYELYNQLIQNYDIRCGREEIIDIDTDDSKSTDLIYLKENVYDSISKEKISLVTNAVKVARRYKIKFEDPFFTVLPISDDELIERTRILFEQLPIKTFLHKFDKFTDPNNHLFHIKYFQKLLTNYKGLSYVDTFDHIPYGLVARDNTVQDIITAAHEVFHMIVREYESPFFLETNRTAYTVAEGYFANLLFTDMLEKLGYNSDEVASYNKRDLQSILDLANTTFVIENGFKLMKNGSINFQRLTPILHKNNILTPINENNFPFFIDEDEMETDINYAISYLIALDLYALYQKDPEKALYHLLTVPILTGDNIRSDLEKIDVTFFDDNYANLNKQCKKLLKRNTTSKTK